MNIFAVTPRGLEKVAAAEMAELVGMRVEQESYRRVSAEFTGGLPALLRLSTVDDVYLHLATWNGIVRQREALARIQENSAAINLAQVASTLDPVRNFPTRPPYSVTASFVGKRNYNTDEIKNAVTTGIGQTNRHSYAENDQPGAVNIRLFIEHDQAYVGARVSDTPLHQRAYKTAHISGSLKPSVAAAMVRLARVTPRTLTLDPFCGAGTIPIEARLKGTPALGGDIEPEAVFAALANARSAGVSLPVLRWDSQKLPLASQSVQRVITNLPWGRQVAVEAELQHFYPLVCKEIERVLAPGGRAVLLTNAAQWVKGWSLQEENRLEISVFGQNPEILIFRK